VTFLTSPGPLVGINFQFAEGQRLIVAEERTFLRRVT
jgi:hypothetical protein